MTIQNIALFQALGAKMDYLDTKQKVIAQNISNADTPNYRAREISDVDFGRVLSDVTGSKKVRMASTNAGHMPAAGEVSKGKNVKQKTTYEVAPSENSVILEEQMMRANETSIDHTLMMNIMRKNIGMIRTALGQGGGQ
ncbi:MAG: flagellar basal body rod protein FlgB [Micavibrio sp.]|nr:flagellar basal body rod protein FlgB [Micavibrio sp.]